MTTAVVKNAYQSDQVAHTYDRQRFTSTAGRLFDRLEKRAIRRQLRAALPGPRAGRVLDIPCGTGRITELLLEAGHRVLGGDISPQMIQAAQCKCAKYADQIKFKRLDLDQLDLPDSSYDLVSCIRLFHHLDSPSRTAVLSTLARATRRYVLINVSFSSPYYRLRRRFKRWLGQGISRESSTWFQIVQEAQQSGLKIHSVRFVLRWLSEDLVILLEKASASKSQTDS